MVYNEPMLTDIEISQQNKMIPIVDVAKKIGINEEGLELYGKIQGKTFNGRIEGLAKKSR